MYARVSTIQGSPERITDEAIQQFRDEPKPYREAKGYQGNYMLVDRQAGKIMVMTLWQTQADLEASAAVASQSRQEGAESAGAAMPPGVEIYEVAVEP